MNDRAKLVYLRPLFRIFCPIHPRRRLFRWFDLAVLERPQQHRSRFARWPERHTLLLNLIKLLLCPSPLVLPFNTVLKAKATSKTSSKDLQGSFWYEDRIYRIIIGDPGILWNAVDKRLIKAEIEATIWTSGAGISDGEGDMLDM